MINKINCLISLEITLKTEKKQDFKERFKNWTFIISTQTRLDLCLQNKDNYRDGVTEGWKAD